MLQQRTTPGATTTPAFQRPLDAAVKGCVIPALLARHAPPPAEIDALVEVLLAGGDGRRQADALRERGHGFDSLMLNLLTPAARALNTYWAEDRGSFATVTLAIWRLRGLMRALADELPAGPCARPALRGVLISTLPGEQHDFGAAMVAEFFARGGWAAQHLRPANTDALLAELRHGGPDVLGFSITRTDALPLLRATIAAIRKALRRRAPSILVGGAALLIEPDIAARSGADGHADCASTALAEAARLVERRANTFPRIEPRKDRIVGLPISRERAPGAGSADHRAASRGRG